MEVQNPIERSKRRPMLIEMSPSEQRRFPSNLHVGKRPKSYAEVSSAGTASLTGFTSSDPFVAEPVYLEDITD